MFLTQKDLTAINAEIADAADANIHGSWDACQPLLAAIRVRLESNTNPNTAGRTRKMIADIADLMDESQTVIC